MNGFLPLMNYSDVIAKDDVVPLTMRQMPTQAPGNSVVNGRYAQMPMYANSYKSEGALGMMPVNVPNGCPPCNCNGAKSSPFENETVQYALLFVLLYVVIKKL